MLTIEEAEKRTILKVLVGSHIHGLNVPTSDRDEEAIIIEPISEAFGLGKGFEELIRESPECDVKYVSLRKWCQLALKGNPNFLLPLFAPASHIIRCDARGTALRDLREAFLSKQAIKAHLGYMQGQRHRMQTGSHGGRGQPRMNLIDEFGYDTKYGMHLLRLGLQGLELATMGTITLPMPDRDRAWLLRVRAGKYYLADVLAWAEDIETRMKEAFFDGDRLPEHPDRNRVEEWMLLMYNRAWSADRKSLDMHEDVEKFGRK